MKNIKNIIFTIVSVALFSISTNHAEPNFELYNKDKAPIGVMIGSQQQIVQANKQLALTINSSQSLYIEVYPNTSIKENMMMVTPYKFKINAQGKTVYLSWNPTKSSPLYPQTGPLMGLMGKTESGLSLSNNISSSNIQKQ
jgi:hypothetical protein